MVHFVPYSTDIGIDKTVSATFLGLIGGFSIPGRLLIGGAADRKGIGTKNALLVCIIVQIFSMFWLLVVRNFWMLSLFIVIFGFSYGGYIALLPFLTAKCFGINSLGTIFGFIIFVATTGGIIGPVLAGFIYDTTSSYRSAFIAGGMISIAGFLAGLFIRTPDERRSGKMQTY